MARPAERGAATAEVVVATPVLLLLVLVVVQAALWFHASHMATAAAQEGARAARVAGGSAAAGEARAQSFLTGLGNQVLQDPQVSASCSAQVARVEVRGHAVGVLPGLHLDVRGVSVGPVEAFRRPSEPGP